MSRILVTYSTNAGSTGEVADTVASELTLGGHTVDVLPIDDVNELTKYDAVVVGAPMIFGWHTKARRFVSHHRKELALKKVAYFACAMSLTQANQDSLLPELLLIDPNLVSDPGKSGSLSIKDRFTSIGYYLKPMLQAAPAVKPVSVSFFKGKLETFRLKWWQAAFVMIVVQAAPGDYRDWDTIKAWGSALSKKL